MLIVRTASSRGATSAASSTMWIFSTSISQQSDGWVFRVEAETVGVAKPCHAAHDRAMSSEVVKPYCVRQADTHGRAIAKQIRIFQSGQPQPCQHRSLAQQPLGEDYGKAGPHTSACMYVWGVSCHASASRPVLLLLSSIVTCSPYNLVPSLSSTYSDC